MNKSPFYDKNLPQFSERVLFERELYDDKFAKLIAGSKQRSAYNKNIPSGLLETINQDKKGSIANTDLYKANSNKCPIALKMDAESIYNKKVKDKIDFRQINYIFK